MSQMAVSNITGQNPGQQNLLGAVNIISSSQSNGQQGLLSTVNVMSSDHTVGPQNSVGTVGNILPVQNVGQQHLLGTNNQGTSTFGPFSHVSEHEKRKYHQQLVLLLHAYKCQKRDSTNGEVRGECNLAQCQGMRHVLGHIQVCQAGSACVIPDCASSKDLILHWKNCTERECALCLPLKQAHSRRQQQPPVMQTSQANQVPNQAVVQRAYSSLGLPPPPANSGVLDTGMQNQGLTSSHENERASQSPSQIVNHIQLSQASQQQSNVQLRTMLQNSVSGTNTNPNSQLVFMGEGIQASVKTTSASLMNSLPNQMSSLVSNVTGTCAPTNVKEWHQAVTSDLRHHLIQRIIQEILVALNKKDLNDPSDPVFNNVIQYARKNEALMYDSANTREEYYHLLAEKIYKIQRKELSDNRQRRPDVRRPQVGTGLEATASINSTPRLPGTSSLSQMNLANANMSTTRQRMPPPNVTVLPNTATRGSELFSAGSQLTASLNNSINMNQSQARHSNLTLNALQQHQFQQQHMNNLNPTNSTIGNSSVDLSSLTSTPISASQFASAQQNSTQVTNAFKSRQNLLQYQQASLLRQVDHEQSLTTGVNSQSLILNQQFQQNQVLNAQQQNQILTEQQQNQVLNQHQNQVLNQQQQNQLINHSQQQGQLLNQQLQQNQLLSQQQQSQILNQQQQNQMVSQQQNQILSQQQQTQILAQHQQNQILSQQQNQILNQQQQNQLLNHQQNQMLNLQQNQALGQQQSNMINQLQQNQALNQQQSQLQVQSQSQTQLNRLDLKSQAGLPYQSPSHSSGNQLAHSSTPQPQSQQSPIQQPPRAASVPVTHPAAPSTPQQSASTSQEEVSTENNNEVQLLQQSDNHCMQRSSAQSFSELQLQSFQQSNIQSHHQSTDSSTNQEEKFLPQPTAQTSQQTTTSSAQLQNMQTSHQNVLVQKIKVEESDDDKTSLSFPETEFLSNQTETNTSQSSVVGQSEPESGQSGGKVFAFASQNISGKEKYPDKMDIEQKIKTENIDSQDSEVKHSPKVDIKTEPESNDNKKHLLECGKDNITVKQETTLPLVKVKTEENVPLIKSEIKTETSEPPLKKFKPNQKIFKPDELRQALMPTLEKLYKQDPESLPFRQPVDPELLQIPDYFDIIKTPMDLSTIKEKLDTGQYQDPWQYVDDVWLMFSNAWLYNKKSSKVYKHCSKLAEVFEQDIDPVMRSLGYCCGRKYAFQPQILCCFGKELCTIARDTKYWSYQNRYIYCQKCFTDISGDTISIVEDPTQPPVVLKKSDFTELKNDHLDQEPFIECTDCCRKLHKICVLHFEQIWREGFICEDCYHKKGKKKKENKFTAKRLPQSKLGLFLENRVNGFLKDRECGAGEVVIRVVSSSEKFVEVKPGMKSRYVETGEMPEKFPYMAKALFAFQEIDGVDTCFFGMHVQEYGSECSPPNTRRVYIAYLDSVHFFQPRKLRTCVYHEILLGYLDYVKRLGYTMAHIWACPPSEGDDYIFHCHPVDQKVPKPKRLQEWYKKMLEKGVNYRIVVDFKDILKQATEDNLKSAAELPYFDDDFWPNVLEESIKEIEKEEEEKRKAEANVVTTVTATTSETDVDEEDNLNGKKKGKKNGRNNKSNKSKIQRKNTKKSNLPHTGNDLTEKIFITMEKHKEVFFVIRLHPVQVAAGLSSIIDPDSFISCELMDGRDQFLTFARDNHHEFSSLRRAKYSTMAMLYALHNQNHDQFVYTCNACKAHVETRYHCSVCEDFDLCVSCYGKEGHKHRMEKLGFGLDDDSSNSDKKQISPQDSRKLSIQRCVQSLVHSSHCRDANCRMPSCLNMKKIVAHAKQCERKTSRGCSICKQFIALCYHHAKVCQETKCPVLFCLNIRHKLRQQQLHHRKQQAQILKRRIATMQNRGLPSASQSSSESSYAVSQPSPVPQPPAPPYPSQPALDVKMGLGSGMNSMQTVPQGQAIRLTMSQHVASANVSYGKNNAMLRQSVPNANLMSQQQMQVQMQKPLPQVLSGVPNRMMGMGNVNRWENANYMPNSQPHQSLQTQSSQIGLRQPTQLMASGNIPTGMSNPGISGQVSQIVPKQGPSIQNPQQHSWNTLIQTLKNPNTPHQQQQVLSILKSNPQLMAAFIKQRQSQKNAVMMQQQQQQKQQQQQQQQQQQLLNGGNVILHPSQPNIRFRQQQMIALHRQQLQQQQQQQVNQFSHPQPPMYAQRPRMPISSNFSHQQRFQTDNSQFQFQQQNPQTILQSQIKQMASPTHPPMSPQQVILDNSQGSIPSPSQQQILQHLRSPPPNAPHLAQAIGSPQPIASPRTWVNVPQGQPIPSPRQQMSSPHYPAQSQSPHSSLSFGTTGLTGSDQMTAGSDLYSHLSNSVSFHPNIANQLQGSVNQDLNISSADNVDMSHQIKNEPLDKYDNF